MNWLLLRGLGRHSGFWYEFPKQLKENVKDCDEVLMIDLPGMNGEETDFRSISDITDEIRKQWLQKKGDKPWNILAISLGGMIALNWVHRYPDDFINIVTINSSESSTSPVYRRLTPTALKYLIKILSDKNVRSREKKVLEVTTNMTSINEKILQDYEAIAKKSGHTGKLVLRQLYAASKFKAPKQIKIPYLVLTSDGDRFTSSTCSKALARKYDAKLFVHDRAGHDLPLDDPMWIIDKLQTLQ